MRPKVIQSPSHQALAFACPAILAPIALQDSNVRSGSKQIPVAVGRTGRRGAIAELLVRSSRSVACSPSVEAIGFKGPAIVVGQDRPSSGVPATASAASR